MNAESEFFRNPMLGERCPEFLAMSPHNRTCIGYAECTRAPFSRRARQFPQVARTKVAKVEKAVTGARNFGEYRLHHLYRLQPARCQKMSARMKSARVRPRGVGPVSQFDPFGLSGIKYCRLVQRKPALHGADYLTCDLLSTRSANHQAREQAGF